MSTATLLKVPSQYSTIQAALNAASSAPLASVEIQVAAGVYEETLSKSLSKKLTIKGAGQNTVIRGAAQLAATSLTMQRLRIEDGGLSAAVLYLPMSGAVVLENLALVGRELVTTEPLLKVAHASGVNVSLSNCLVAGSRYGATGALIEVLNAGTFVMDHVTAHFLSDTVRVNYVYSVPTGVYTNCIFTRGETAMACFAPSAGTPTYSFTSAAGTGNVNDDPLFTDKLQLGFRPLKGSQAIGGGNDGLDIGCYQYQPTFRFGVPSYGEPFEAYRLRHNFQVLDLATRGGRERFNSLNGTLIEFTPLQQVAYDLDYTEDDAPWVVGVSCETILEDVGVIYVQVVSSSSFIVYNTGGNDSDMFTWTLSPGRTPISPLE